MEKEIWKDIPGYEGLYQASDLGRIRSVEHTQEIQSRTKGCFTRIRQAIIRSQVNVGSYKSVNLSNGKHRKMWRVHRLVCMTFNGNKHNTDLVIDHINNDKHDNRAVNLRWVTLKQNSQFSVQDGLIKATFNKTQSYRFKKLNELGFSYRRIAKWYNTSHGVISNNIRINCNG